MIVHEATVHREGPWLVAEVAGLGATQSRKVDELRVLVDHLVVAMTGADPATFVIDLREG